MSQIMLTNVLEYLEPTVERVPDKVAFANETDAFTFREVDEYHKRIATFLADREMEREPVVVFMKKHPRTIVTFLGVIASGNYYVPVDDEMPVSRMNLILQTCKPGIILCDEDTKEKAQKLDFKGEIRSFEEAIKPLVNHERLKKIRERAIDTDPIYIVFTSGSTGIPKGVVACHRSVLDYIERLSEVLEFGKDTVFGNQSPLYFDACLKEIYPTLKYGATTYLIPKKLFMFPVKLVEFLNAKKINTICWVVSALTMISGFGTFDKVKPRYLKSIAFGSEVFPIKQFNLWREALPDAKFTNLYGPTEGTGMCCYYHVDREFKEGDKIPIGRPFRNTEILLLTEDGQLADKKEGGEICIRGTSVTLGYYGNAEKTKESYIQNPLNPWYPEVIYKTGDIGKYNEYGELIYISRKDFQIKHMGHRIELPEIEADCNTIGEIQYAACIYDEVRAKIVLFYVGKTEKTEVLSQLKEKLPRYMLPNEIISIPNMPFTSNGKIDRVCLKKMYYEENRK